MPDRNSNQSRHYPLARRGRASATERGGAVNHGARQFIDAALPRCSDSRTLVKIDVAGADDQVIPSLAPLLTTAKPFVYVSLSGANVMACDDPYVHAVARLTSALVVAEALAAYRYLYVHVDNRWMCVDPPSRLRFLRRALLSPKPVAECSTPEYPVIDAVGLSDTPLDELGG